MSFPQCKHAKKKRPAAVLPLVWLGSEPYRLFFLSGTLFSIFGVLLWPLFYMGKLDFYPGVNHAHVMIQAFGGAFVIGFLGTAGPRLLGAPRLKPWELCPLFLLHLAGGICHLFGKTQWGDWLFLATLGGFLLSLSARLVFFRKNWPPPPLLLAGTGLLCGLAGTLLWCNPEWMRTPEWYLLAGRLLNQGFLLGPVMGVGIFLFPRLLGKDFGETTAGRETQQAWWRMALASLALVLSFPLEIWGSQKAGLILRLVAFLFAVSNVSWFGKKEGKAVGTLGNALRFCCIPLAVAGLLAPVFLLSRHTALFHLLYIGGFGFVCLIAASRVIFGHSGDVARFGNRSWIARTIVFGVVLACLTRVSADFLPRVMIIHYDYAAYSWSAAALLWLAWHSRRFFKKDEED